MTRQIRQCRDFYGWPIEYDNGRQGYILDRDQTDNFQLPGFWFTAAEIHALLVSHRLLSSLKPGIFEAQLAPLRNRLESLVKHRQLGGAEVFERVRILAMAPREVDFTQFQTIARALLDRRQLRIQYSSRSKEELTDRWVSPQRLVYYRDNWYLDAWCHHRQGLRTFSLDRMNLARTGERAIEVPDQELDSHVTATYGIFAGTATERAVIHFSDHAARWVADELWHPQQESRLLPEGGWELIIPYGQPEELLRDILKFGPDARVVAPDSLKRLVLEKLHKMVAMYRSD